MGFVGANFTHFGHRFVQLTAHKHYLRLFSFARCQRFLHHNANVPQLVFLAHNTRTTKFHRTKRYSIDSRLRHIHQTVLGANEAIFTPHAGITFVHHNFCFSYHSKYRSSLRHAGEANRRTKFATGALLLVSLGTIVGITSYTVETTANTKHVFAVIANRYAALLLVFSGHGSKVGVILTRSVLLVVIDRSANSFADVAARALLAINRGGAVRGSLLF